MRPPAEKAFARCTAKAAAAERHQCIKTSKAPHTVRGAFGQTTSRATSRATAGLQSGGCAIRFALFSAFGLVLVLALTLALMAPDSGDKLMQLDRKSLEIRLGVLGVCPHQGALSGKALVDH